MIQNNQIKKITYFWFLYFIFTIKNTVDMIIPTTANVTIIEYTVILMRLRAIFLCVLSTAGPPPWKTKGSQLSKYKMTTIAANFNRIMKNEIAAIFDILESKIPANGSLVKDCYKIWQYFGTI